MNTLKTLLSLACAMTVTAAHALELPNIFGNDMMLQQQTKAKIWGWAKPDSKVTVQASWTRETLTAKAGQDGKWLVELQTPQASRDVRSVTVKGDGQTIIYNNVLIGEVWFCSGQSNMEMPLGGFWNCPVEGANEAIAMSGQYRSSVRVATFPKAVADVPQRNVKGGWQTCCPENARQFSAVAFFFARTLTDILDVPVGVINCSYGGSCVEGWLPKETLLTYPDGLTPIDDTEYHRKMVMYNAMLHPLAGYTVKGFLWNQGESNVGREQEYIDRFITMTRLWRKLWQQPADRLPMYTVELPPYWYDDANGDWGARFRSTQHQIAARLENSGCVCTSDLIRPYELKQIHGSMKLQIGQRLAYMAAARDYGVKGLECDAPEFSHMTKHEATGDEQTIIAGTAVSENPGAKGQVVRLYFTNSRDGFDRMDNIEGFEAAGADGVWHKATVWASSQWQQEPSGCFLKLVCPAAGDIVRVRYCYKNFAIGTLHNAYGLPIVPFCTD